MPGAGYGPGRLRPEGLSPDASVGVRFAGLGSESSHRRTRESCSLSHLASRLWAAMCCSPTSYSGDLVPVLPGVGDGPQWLNLINSDSYRVFQMKILRTRKV